MTAARALAADQQLQHLSNRRTGVLSPPVRLRGAPRWIIERIPDLPSISVGKPKVSQLLGGGPFTHLLFCGLPPLTIQPAVAGVLERARGTGKRRPGLIDEIHDPQHQVEHGSLDHGIVVHEGKSFVDLRDDSNPSPLSLALSQGREHVQRQARAAAEAVIESAVDSDGGKGSHETAGYDIPKRP